MFKHLLKEVKASGGCQFAVSDFDEEALKKSPKLFSKALLASIYLNRTKNKMSLGTAYKRALLREVW